MSREEPLLVNSRLGGTPVVSPITSVASTRQGDAASLSPITTTLSSWPGESPLLSPISAVDAEAGKAGGGVDADSSEGGGVCRHFGKGSLWGTVFNLCAATLGAGALSLPHAIAAMGLVPGLILLTITAFATHYSIVLLVACLDATNARSFEDLSVQVFGKLTGHLVEASIIVFCFGTCVAYTVAVGDILNPFLGPVQ
jgi:hypothetical protein